VELLLKLAVHRVYLFCNHDYRWNCLDVVLVFTGMLQVVVDALIDPGNGLGNPGFVRLIRLARISRALRMVRLLKFFRELRLMLKCVVGSFMSLFWAFFLIFCFSLVFGIVLVQRMTSFLVEDGVSRPLGVVAAVRESFGSVQLACLTLFHAISGGDWMVVWQLVKLTGWENLVIFAFYFLFVWLSVTNIITCIFVEKAMKLALPDLDQQLFDKQKDDVDAAQDIRTLYEELVGSKDTCLLKWEDFHRAVEDPRIASRMVVTGVEVSDAFMFFKMLSSISGQDEIDADTFIKGCMKMKGYAMNIDLLQLSYEIKVFSKHQQKLILALHHDIEELQRRLGNRSSP